MISAHLLAVYIAALFVVYAVPGPDMALLLQTSIGRGARSGFAAAGGLGLARATHVTLSACGVAALLRSAPWLYDVVRYGGAVYLAWVGIQIFRSPVFALPDAATAGAAAGGESRPLRAAFVKGLLTNLLNPGRIPARRLRPVGYRVRRLVELRIDRLFRVQGQIRCGRHALDSSSCRGFPEPAVCRFHPSRQITRNPRQ